MTTTQITDFKYFHWGLYPANSPVYGLYEPITDCFLLILNSLETARTLKYILSSRYAIYLCRLDSASNFSSDLIDNSCCENWSFANKDKDLIIDQNLLNSEIITVEELCRSASKKVWDIDKEKRWCLFCQYIVQHFIENPHSQYSQIMGVVSRFLKFEEFYNDMTAMELQHKILPVLYFGSDVSVASQEIKQIVADLPLANLL